MLIELLQPNFKFEDERGLLVQIIREGYKQVNFITAKKDSVRGGHFHKYNKEAFFILEGCFELTLKHINTKQEEKYRFSTGDFFSIPAYTSHSFSFTEDTKLISFYSNGVELKDGTKDIFPEP